MLELTKAVVNNLNRFKYMKNIKRVEINSDTNSIVDDEEYLKEIKYLEEDARINNLQVFGSVYGAFKLKRFFVVTAPALLVAVALGTIPLAKNAGTKEKEATVIEVENTLYNVKLGENKTEEKVYYLDSGELSPKNENYEAMQIVSRDEVSNRLTFKMYDETDSMVAILGISDYGKLILNDIDTGSYVDFIDYSEIDFSPASFDYDSLLDIIIETIKTSSEATGSDLAILEKLTASDKANIVMEIKKYVATENIDVLVKKNNYASIILGVIACIYLFIEALLCTDRDIREATLTYNGVVRNDSELIVNDSEYKMSFWEFLLSYFSYDVKENFLAAERGRIYSLAQEVATNIVEKDRDKIFTNYEKKLLKK